MEDILAVVLLFGGATLVLLSMSPVGRALAHRIKGGGVLKDDDSLHRLEETQKAVLDELDALRQEVSDVQERLDFTERLLARHQEPAQLGDGEARQD
jgi:hypothetical protein